MPRPLSPEPLQRTDLNLYANDIEFLKRKLGVGWTTYIRELVAEDVKRMSRVKTIGDLVEEPLKEIKAIAMKRLYGDEQ